MEIRHRILEFNNSPKYKLLKSELLKLGCLYKFNENGWLSSIEYTFSEHDPLAPHLLKICKSKDFSLASGLYYSDVEIIQSEWVIAEVGEFQYPQPDNYIETTYNTQNYCGRCGQGKIQNNPFRLKKDFVQKQAKFLGLHWVFDEIFIRPIIKNIFDAEGISGINYREVIHHKSGNPISNLLQLDIQTIESPALITDNLFSVTCKPQNEESYIKGFGRIKDRSGLPFCGRIKYQYPLTEPIIFREKDLRGLPDIVKSFECYGSGSGAYHFILVHHNVVQLIMNNGIKGIGLRRPIHLV